MFKGYDWMELADYFNVEIPDPNDDRPLADFLRRAETKEVCPICRKFLNAIIKVDISYNKPLWKGLAKVKDDGTFMGFFAELIGHIWT